MQKLNLNLSFLTSVSIVGYKVASTLNNLFTKEIVSYEALRAAATVVKVENAMRLDHIANSRKRRREEGEQINATRHFGKVHYLICIQFSVNFIIW